MMNTVGDRIRAFREWRNLTQKDVFQATKGEIKQTSLSAIENNQARPGYDTLAALFVAYPDLNPDWLLLGAGTMFRSATTVAAAPAPLPTLTLAEEPAAAYGCVAPDLVVTLTKQLGEAHTRIVELETELRDERKQARQDLRSQAALYNSVKESQEATVARLYAKLDEYELRLGYRQPTQEERQQLQEAGGAPRMEVKPFGARYREATTDEPQASSEGPGGLLVAMYEYSLVAAA